jgi:hypothetical protein
VVEVLVGIALAGAVLVVSGGAVEQRVELGARQVDQPLADAHLSLTDMVLNLT